MTWTKLPSTYHTKLEYNIGFFQAQWFEQPLFGGHVSKYRNKCSRWHLSGTRARGFLMTMYKFLSPHRKLQVFGALHLEKIGSTLKGNTTL